MKCLLHYYGGYGSLPNRFEDNYILTVSYAIFFPLKGGKGVSVCWFQRNCKADDPLNSILIHLACSKLTCICKATTIRLK
uniref:Putative ovule protein n=1 Tax=Solanum chacoense TaxID=4108 RepID=A0A0V0H1V5_SOLCH